MKTIETNPNRQRRWKTAVFLGTGEKVQEEQREGGAVFGLLEIWLLSEEFED